MTTSLETSRPADNANRAVLQDLIDMSESRTEEVERISCAEEERAIGATVRLGALRRLRAQ
jgi:hypothetical protein